ncbi:hypothetical protein Drorol1_Dr00001584 [Drosera rotundifolia]
MRSTNDGAGCFKENGWLSCICKIRMLCSANKKPYSEMEKAAPARPYNPCNSRIFKALRRLNLPSRIKLRWINQKRRWLDHLPCYSTVHRCTTRKSTAFPAYVDKY